MELRRGEASGAWAYHSKQWERSGLVPGSQVFTMPLARQRKPQITRYFATQMLPYHKLKSDSDGYKQEQIKLLTCLAFL